MKIIFAVPFAAVAAFAVSVCPKHPSIGLWEPQRDEVFVNALQALGLRDFSKIEKLNQGLDPNSIRLGRTYTVPYTSSLDASARWTTSSCTPFLHLADQFVTATATQEEASAVVDTTTTLNPTGKGLSETQIKSDEPRTLHSSHGNATNTGVMVSGSCTTTTPQPMPAATAKATNTPKTTHKTSTTTTTPSRSNTTTTFPDTTMTSTTTPPSHAVGPCTCSQ